VSGKIDAGSFYLGDRMETEVSVDKPHRYWVRYGIFGTWLFVLLLFAPTLGAAVENFFLFCTPVFLLPYGFLLWNEPPHERVFSNGTFVLFLVMSQWVLAGAIFSWITRKLNLVTVAFLAPVAIVGVVIVTQILFAIFKCHVLLELP
jgi:hypothetical protein